MKEILSHIHFKSGSVLGRELDRHCIEQATNRMWYTAYVKVAIAVTLAYKFQVHLSIAIIF